MTAPVPDDGASLWERQRRWAGELGAVVANARRTFGLLLATNRWLAATLVALTIVDAALPVAIAYVGKHIIDAVVAAAGAHTPAATRLALQWVAIECGLMLARMAVTQLSSLAQTLLRTALATRVNVLILEKATNVSYRHFEDPAFNDQLSQARREASSRPLDVVRSLLALARNAITLAGYGALLAGLSGWAVAALCLSALPPVVAEARHGREAFLMQRRRTFDNRQAHYLEMLLSQEATTKEIKLFALSGLLLGRFRALYARFHDEDSALARRRVRSSVALGALSTLTLYACYAWIAARTVAGELTVGSMMLYVVGFREGQAAFQSGLLALARLYEDNLFMTNLFEYLSLPEDEPHEPIPASIVAADGGATTGAETNGGLSASGDGAVPAAGAVLPADDAAPDDGRLLAPPPRIELCGVSFRYPGATRDSLCDVTLTIEPGEAVAVVGPNGAGKTTLVKLLTGLYRPTAGVILIDGVDVTTLGPARLRRLVGVIFQDFVRFHFTVADNIGVGWLPEMSNQEEIARAAAAGGIDEVIARLPDGYAQGLGRWFGGEELSAGQWQRLALARAFMRRSPVLILDEPTATLDAEAEHEIFVRFRRLTAGRTALLITHRFSTVRMADRIVVFEDGRLTEAGTHADLLETGMRYARMFRLQAAGYSEP